MISSATAQTTMPAMLAVPLPEEEVHISLREEALRLADRIARLRGVDPESVELAVDWLDALLRRQGPRGHGSGPRR